MADALNAMADRFDKQLLKMIKSGKKMVLGHDGTPTEVDLTAADLNVIRQRLKDCGITSARTKGSTIDQLAEAMGGDSFKFPAPQLPEVPEGDDAATA